MLILRDEFDSMPLRASKNQNVTKGDCGSTFPAMSCNLTGDFPTGLIEVEPTAEPAKRFQSRQFALSAHATIQLQPHRWRKRLEVLCLNG